MATSATRRKEDPSKPKPRNLGHAADMLYETQAELKSLRGALEERQARESWLKEFFINNLPKSEASGISGQYINVRVENKTVPKVLDWPTVFAWIARTKSWDMIQRRLNEGAVLARIEEGKAIKGMDTIDVPVVRIRKA